MPTNSRDSRLAQAEPTIRRLSRRFCRSHRDDIEDAAQSARLALLESLSRFDPSRDFLKFANAVVRNALIDFTRGLKAPHRQADALSEDLAGLGGGENDTFITDLMTRPDDLLGKRQSHLFQLFLATENRSELADILGVSNAIADQRISRLTRIIKQLAAA